MENKTLTDPMEKPESKVLETALGKKYSLYTDFVNKLSELNLILEWNYYKDEKSWLCKILNKKKNIAWLSVWNTGFKLTFYFNENTIEGMYELDIDNEIKDNARNMKPVGKFRPVMILIKNKKLVNNGIKLLEYKMSILGLKNG
ncbi:MAG: DUF3788 domain-containing protein, partial [Treponema sp.]|nr:DUF3788 domain-containing protein [Treponema sp.]